MQITRHIHALKIPFQITIAEAKTVNRFVYIYMICGEKVWLIDTGVSGSEKVIFNYLKTIGRRPEEISKIILTHSHPDHIGSAKSIKEITGCSIVAHPAERSWIEDVGSQFRERPVPGFNSLVGGSVTVDHAVEDGDLIEPDNIPELRVVHTPGHSKGSLSFFLKNDNALFCGDAILLPGQMPIYENILACVESVNKLKRIKGAEILLSSWDEPRKGGEVYKAMDDSLEYLSKIRAAVKSVAVEKIPQDPMEFCKLVLGKLGLPEAMANPLIGKAFWSSLNPVAD